jgi:hypothetical protein
LEKEDKQVGCMVTLLERKLVDGAKVNCTLQTKASHLFHIFVTSLIPNENALKQILEKA